MTCSVRSLMVSPSFKFVEKTIAQLLEQVYPPHLSITVTNRNADGLAEVVRFALERDLTFSINFFATTTAPLDSVT